MNQAWRRSTSPSPARAGFSLVELMVTVAVLGIIAAIATPSMVDMIDRKRAVGAVEEAYSLLHMARSEAIKQSRTTRVTMSEGAAGSWLIGLSHGSGACTDANDCKILESGTGVTRMSDPSRYPGVKLAASQATFAFNPRGLASGIAVDGATLDFTSQRGWTARLALNPIGRIRLCSPSATTNAGGYKPC